ncbi:MAG TPA: ATP-binding protein [Candidatus Angelobacter sp.]
MTWDHLPLEEAQKEVLREMALHATKVRSASPPTCGLAALFTGPGGTGKTMAAEALAQGLNVKLQRIDLGQVVSKFIGETEKNLERIFAAGEAGGAILFFDEADALFGNRSEVKDSHDRFANLEVNYLLHRIEGHPGLVIVGINNRQTVLG